MTLLALFGTFEWIIILLSAIFLLLLPALALLHLFRHQFDANTRLIWVVVILLLPYLGSVLYFLIGRRQRLDK